MRILLKKIVNIRLCRLQMILNVGNKKYHQKTTKKKFCDKINKIKQKNKLNDHFFLPFCTSGTTIRGGTGRH